MPIEKAGRRAEVRRGRLDVGLLLQQASIVVRAILALRHMPFHGGVLNRIEFIIEIGLDQFRWAVHPAAPTIRLAAHASRRLRALESLDITVPNEMPVVSAISR